MAMSGDDNLFLHYATQGYASMVAAASKAQEAALHIPGSPIVIRYIRNSYQNDPVRIALELFLFFFAVKYLLSKRYNPDKTRVQLSAREIDELVDDWSPEPLVPELTAWEQKELEKAPTITSAVGLKVKVATSSKTLINLSSYNYLGLSGLESVKDKAIMALRKYGVGACGPPGFYGTVDVHMQLEQELAKFFNAPQAIIYAQGFSAISSVVPAFSKRGDLIVVDEGVSFALQKAFQISRSKVVFFKHNDMNDLEHKLAQIAESDRKQRKPLYRKFILVEGIYHNYGDLAPLPKLVELKKKFKYRLVVEESYSFGAIGSRGAGLTDHFNVPVNDVDFIVATMSNALCSAGGFCIGELAIIEHQRLSASAYVYSAALPPMLAVTAIEGLDHLKANCKQLMPSLRDNIATLRAALVNVPGLVLDSSPESPLQHIRARGVPEEEQDQFLQEVVDDALANGVLLTRSKFVATQELKCPPPSIRVVASAALTRKEIESCGKVIKSSFTRIMGQWAKRK
ncbi:serine palmitoyltransferase component [Sorochytrium milnesiophthora]